MRGILPSWIERLLGIEAVPGEGTQWSLEHSWPWPPWATLLLFVFAVVFVLAIYAREGAARRRLRLSLAVVRLTLLGLVALMIAQLSLSLQRTGLPYVVVIVDDSLSMTVVDGYEDNLTEKLRRRVEKAKLADDSLSRWNLLRTLLRENDNAMLRRIADNYKLRVYFLSGAPTTDVADVSEISERLKSLEPTGQSSRLGQCVQDALDDLRGATPAAVVLLSDGINTDGPALAETAMHARRKGVPLFTVAIGSDKPARDLKLSDLLVEPLVFVDDVVNFEMKLTTSGYAGKKVTVVLHEAGKTDPLAEVEVTAGSDGQSQQVRLPYRPRKVGHFRYVVEVTPQDGELQTENNRQIRAVEVRKEKIRVLLAQAYPNYEFRYLRSMLGRDDTMELHTVLQDADAGYDEQDASALPVFPVSREALFSYDVVILGDVNPAMFGAAVMKNLVDFVDQPGNGGGLVLIAGPKYMPLAFRDTPLEALMPVDLSAARLPDPNQTITEGFVARPTELGLSSPAMQLGDTPAETRQIWENLAPLYWMMEVPAKKPARVLAVRENLRGADGMPLPLFCMQYVGAGKVLFHATDETWRWRLRVGDVYFARYWVQTIRYLSRGKLVGGDGQVSLSSEKREYASGDTVRLRARFRDERTAPAEDDGVTVVLEHEGHKTRRIRLHRAAVQRGSFEGLIGGLQAGNYHAWIAIPIVDEQAPAADFSVALPSDEFRRVRADSSAMSRAARQTEGKFYTPINAARLPRDLPSGQKDPIESLPSKPLWNTWPVLAACIFLLMLEWILRKRGGMV
jgi:hypothetical protein